MTDFHVTDAAMDALAKGETPQVLEVFDVVLSRESGTLKANWNFWCFLSDALAVAIQYESNPDRRAIFLALDDAFTRGLQITRKVTL